MKILVINSGSSSIKYQLFRMPEQKVIAKGLLERIGEAESVFTQKSERGAAEIKKPVPNHEVGVKFILEMLTDCEHGVIGSVDEIEGIGHRVLHCGEKYTEPVIITPDVEKVIEDYFDLGPLHNPPNLAGIKACGKALPHAVQVAVIDTSFHSTMPPHAYLYAIPMELYRKFRIRKYGFHGTSHRYVSKRCAEIMGREPHDVNIITVHLGNGCSMAAVEKGRCIDTSMGLTPLEGLVMGTRSGDIDASVCYFLTDKGYSSAEVNNILNKKSGLLGLSELSNDMRNLVEAKDKGHKGAALAIESFNYRLKKYIGSYLAALGKTDAIAFTGGIGENNAACRRESLKGLEPLGVKLDEEKNKSAAPEKLISRDDSPVKVYVVPTNEELQIARDTYALAEPHVPNH
ncbi:MAG: acetate kinase [Deltaproteobacteria bacterium]